MKFKSIGFSFLALLMLSMISCSSSYEQKSIRQADKHYKMALDAKANENMRGYFAYTQRGLRVLLDFMQNDVATKEVREKYIELNIDLGKTVVENFERDPQGKARVLAAYENIMRYIYSHDYDTLKTEDEDGKEVIRVEKNERKDLSPETYTAHANFLAQVAETFKEFESTREALPYIILAKEIDPNNAAIKKQFENWENEIASIALERAKSYYESFKDEKIDDIPADPAIAAEYFSLLTLKYAPENKEAKELISKIRPKITHIYSAYIRLLDYAGLTAQELDRDINKHDVLMAFINFDRRGGQAAAEISIYNYSYNPIELRPEVFFLVDADGKRYKAKRTNHSREMPSKLLDMEWEERGALWFDVPARADIVKLVFDMERENRDGTTEKFYSEKYIK